MILSQCTGLKGTEKTGAFNHFIYTTDFYLYSTKGPLIVKHRYSNRIYLNRENVK